MKASILSLVVGVLMIGMRIVDTFLGSPQQNRINDRFDSFALWLAYAKPVEWLAKLRTPRGQIVLLAIGSAELLAFLSPTVWSSFNTSTRGERVILIILVLLLLLSLPIIVNRVGPRVTAWLLGDAEFLIFLSRYVLLIVVYVAGMFVYLLICVFILAFFGFHDVQSADGGLMLRIAFFPVFPLMILHWVLVQVGAIVILAAVTLFILEILMKIARPIAFYISVHVRRPYFILTGMIAILLGIFNLYLSQVRK